MGTQKRLITYAYARVSTRTQASVSTINRWETGKVKPNLAAMKSLKEFCEKYKLPYDEIETEWFSFAEKE